MTSSGVISLKRNDYQNLVKRSYDFISILFNNLSFAVAPHNYSILLVSSLFTAMGFSLGSSFSFVGFLCANK